MTKGDILKSVHTVLFFPFCDATVNVKAFGRSRCHIFSVMQLKLIQIASNVHNIQNCFRDILTTKHFNSVSDSESIVYINPKC